MKKGVPRMTERYDFYPHINIVTLTPVEEFCSCSVENYFATQKESLGIHPIMHHYILRQTLKNSESFFLTSLFSRSLENTLCLSVHWVAILVHHDLVLKARAKES